MYYLFYRLYKFFEIVENALTPKSIRTPEYSAMFIGVLLIYFNIFTIELYIKKFFGINILFSKKEIALTVAIIILVYNFYTFLFKNKFKGIIEKYKNETKLKKRLSIILTLVYVVGSILLLIIVT